MNFEITTTPNETAWRTFIEQNPHANVFHSPEMQEVFSRVKGHDSRTWAAVNSQGEIYALLPLVDVTLMDGALSRLTTRSIAYGGILHAPNPDGEAALIKLLETYTKTSTKSLFTELRNLHDLSDTQPLLEKYGFKFEAHLNYLIDLDKPTEDVLQNIGKRTRKKIRSELRKERILVRDAEDKSQFDDWYQLLSETYAAAQVPLGDKSLFEAAFDVLHPKGMIKFPMAFYQEEEPEKLVSCSAELLFKDIIYGWYGGTDRDYQNYNPNEMVMWHILEYGAERHYTVYDFGGAGKPDEEYGVRDFKSKFNGELVNYGRNTFVPNPNLLKLSKFGYDVYRRFL